MTIKVCIPDGYGLNCGYETKHAFELAGDAVVDRVHINELVDGTKKLEDYHILFAMGGFSYGDDHGAGVLEAAKLKTTLGDSLAQFILDGKLIAGVCNGFQMLVNLGILPAIDSDYDSRDVALMANDIGNFRNSWVDLSVNQESPCVWTKGMESLRAPVRHGEGKFYAKEKVLDQLSLRQQIVLQYRQSNSDWSWSDAFPHNPNGSLRGIAGICDPSGRVFGLMPHPEAALYFTNLPDWTIQKSMLRRQGQSIPVEGPGRQIFENAYTYCVEELL